MPSSIWEGSLSFGLIEIPVSIQPLIQYPDSRMKILDRKNNSPVRYVRVNPVTGREVLWEDTIHGFEYDKSKFVVLTDEDLKSANPTAIGKINIFQFVDPSEIDPVFYDIPYVLVPLQRRSKTYSIFRAALQNSNRAGLARIVLRGQEKISVIRNYGQGILMHLLRDRREIKSLSRYELPVSHFEKTSIHREELNLCVELIQQLKSGFHPERYRNLFMNDLLAFVEKKLASMRISAEMKSSATKAHSEDTKDSFVDLLKKSLESARKLPTRLRLVKSKG
jgi:DNA end-binding protein Ku